ncbi:MAG TPA: OpgC domain-containing protein [Xanthobacteraceae bacterium]|nr:OpgC domain-containing protein [Xanthobacteraceae bacterium]
MAGAARDKDTPRARDLAAPPVAASSRDLRLDLFRGIALWLIFIDHIPNNVMNWFTLRNYGFSDAAEVFIFISGYTAAFVYGRAMRERGFLVAGARILKRVWQLYVAHVFLFAIFMAQIAYFQTASNLENPVYAEEVRALDFLQRPDETIIQALLLAFKPSYMDILPLYIVLLLFFAPILWLLQKNATLALALSVLIYAGNWQFGWNLKSYPSGHWFFNPVAWQLLFVFGAWCALGGAERLARVLRSPIVISIAAAYLGFAFAIALTWHFPRLAYYIPSWLREWMYPIDKTNLDILRFSHFLALAAVTVYFVRPYWSWIGSRLLKPAILCGQHSLEIFCLGVFLSFAGHFVIVEFYGGYLMQVLVSLTGIAVMTGVAALISWYKSIERASAPAKKKSAPDIAGGQA